MDEWPISEAPNAFAQHRTLEDRLAAARTFVDDYAQPAGLRWFVDDIRNSLNRQGPCAFRCCHPPACSLSLLTMPGEPRGMDCAAMQMAVRWPLCAGFNTAYASWPFRFWVLTEDRVAFKPMPHELSS